MVESEPFAFRIDLHVHSRRFSPCAEALDPQGLDKMMSRRGLDGVVITEHDALWPEKDIVELNQSATCGRIFRGVEVSSRNGHFILIGLNEIAGIAAGIDLPELFLIAESIQAAIIWAHPGWRYANTPEPLNFATMPSMIHAVEVASSVTTGEKSVEAARFANTMGLSAVGGSDAHHLGQVGYAFTCFKRLPADEHELAAEIRSGCCQAGFFSVCESPSGGVCCSGSNLPKRWS